MHHSYVARNLCASGDVSGREDFPGVLQTRKCYAGHREAHVNQGELCDIDTWLLSQTGMGGSALLRALRHRVVFYNGQRWLSGKDRGEINTLLEEAYTQKYEEEDEESPKPDRRSPTDSTVLLFPGQGSQAVGMAGGLLKYPNVRAMFLTAHKVLGYDLLDLCLRGPTEVLNKTIHCQPAMFVTCVAATEKLNQENPSVS